MKHKLKLILGVSLLLIMVVFACKQKQLPKTEPELVQNIAEQWSKALNNKHIDSLNFLYADSVLLYGAKESKYKALAIKADYLNTHPDFKHTIKNISSVNIGEGLYKTTFTKQISQNGEQLEVEGLLLLQKQGDKWLIISESDTPTEAKLAKEAQEIAETQTVQFEQKVSLKGELSTSDYTDVNSNKCTMYILKLSNRLDVTAPNTNYKSLANVKEVQIGFDESEQPEKYLDKVITVTGEIYGEETIHDRRPVVMIKAVIQK